MLTKLRHRIGKWIWKENSWTKAVDEIEKAVMDLRNGECEEAQFEWKFTYMKTPPSNHAIIKIRLIKKCS